jgi:DNA-binding IclR family transcriptional regulator
MAPPRRTFDHSVASDTHTNSPRPVTPQDVVRDRRSRPRTADDSRPHISDERGWQSIGRALRVLEIIGSHQQPVSLTHISTEVQLTISTTHRILRGLETRGFVHRDQLTGDYSVGPSILRLAHSALQQTADGDLALLAFPRLQRLRELTKETVGFHVVSGLRRMCLAELPSHQPIRVAEGVGANHVLGIGAPGKAILAHLHGEVVERVVAQDEFQTRSKLGKTVPVVTKALAAIARDGFAISYGEVVPGASGIALPIRDARGIARGALNITGPESRWTRTEMMRHVDAAQEVAEFIEKRLGRG